MEVASLIVSTAGLLALSNACKGLIQRTESFVERDQEVSHYAELFRTDRIFLDDLEKSTLQRVRQEPDEATEQAFRASEDSNLDSQREVQLYKLMKSLKRNYETLNEQLQVDNQNTTIGQEGTPRSRRGVRATLNDWKGRAAWSFGPKRSLVLDKLAISKNIVEKIRMLRDTHSTSILEELCKPFARL